MSPLSEIINSFVIKERKERYLNLISTKAGIIKFRSYFAHFGDLDSKFAKQLLSLISNSELYELLKLKGAPKNCQIFSEHSTAFDINADLQQTLNKMHNSGVAFFLSCIPGKLAYFEGEEKNAFYLLEK